MKNILIVGLMGMASFSDDLQKVRNEFKHLKNIFHHLQIPNHNLTILSMGMSGDYQIALEEGSNLLRIGSLLFGARN